MITSYKIQTFCNNLHTVELLIQAGSLILILIQYKVHQTFFAQCGRKRCQSNSFPILDISIRSEDIRAHSGKVSKIRPNLACFSPPIFLGGRPPNFRTGICKLDMLPTMWQNFAKIDPQTSEISRG